MPLESEKNISFRDVSNEFVQMSSSDFSKFLKQCKNDPVLSISIDWIDVPTARRLKAFLEDPRVWEWNQKRTAAIRATEEEYKKETNVFESGVAWIRKEK